MAAQPQAGSLQSAIDCTLADAKVFRQLAVAPALCILEQEDLGIASREPLQRLPDQFPPLLGQ
jgi:hypothetical protein